jgi:hypothetical protein
MAGNIGTRFGDSSNGTPHPYSVLLRRGQTYTVRADTTVAINDEAGSVVESDKPIAVFGAHDAALNNITPSTYWGLEQRNMLVQEMLPYEYWATRDYLSISMIDSAAVGSYDPGVGEKVRAVTYDSSNSIRLVSSNDQDTTGYVDRYRTLDAENIRGGYSVSSSSQLPLLPFAIDYRLASSSLVSSAPTMLQLVPWQNATNLYTFAVTDDSHTRKRQYISIIARADQFSDISMWTNGIGPRQLNVLPKIGGDQQIPGRDDLLGRTYEVTAGAYELRADSNFILYQYGRVTYSLNGGWSEESPTTFVTAYAAAGGMRLRTAATARPVATATRTCGGWSISL